METRESKAHEGEKRGREGKREMEGKGRGKMGKVRETKGEKRE